MGKTFHRDKGGLPTLEALGVSVLDGGEGWVALEKPCGVSVHNEPGRDLVSVVTRTLDEDPSALRQIVKEEVPTVHAVHRLDGDTSGVVLFAFGKEAAKLLTRQFEEKRVAKEYVALVHGSLEPGKGSGRCLLQRMPEEGPIPRVAVNGCLQQPLLSWKRAPSVTRWCPATPFRPQAPDPSPCQAGRSSHHRGPALWVQACPGRSGGAVRV